MGSIMYCVERLNRHFIRTKREQYCHDGLDSVDFRLVCNENLPLYAKV